MEQRKVNPWTWQDEYGFSQAIEVTGAERVLYCAGQTSTGARREHGCARRHGRTDGEGAR